MRFKLIEEKEIVEAGYHGYSMSNNAVAAYQDGEMPLSKWTKEAIISAIEDYDPSKVAFAKQLPLSILKSLALSLVSWHHTSKFYNPTDFYALNTTWVDELSQEIIDELIEEQQQKKERESTLKLNGYILSKDEKTLEEVNPNLETFKIPSGVETIGASAFKNHNKLRTLYIPLSVTYFGYTCFKHCKDLKNIIYSGTLSQWGAIFKRGSQFPYHNVKVACSNGFQIGNSITEYT